MDIAGPHLEREIRKPIVYIVSKILREQIEYGAISSHKLQWDGISWRYFTTLLIRPVWVKEMESGLLGKRQLLWFGYSNSIPVCTHKIILRAYTIFRARLSHILCELHN